METVERKSLRLGADQRSGAAVTEQEKHQQFSDVVRVLKMQRAEFHADNEDARIGRRANDVASELQGVDRRIAAHESDDSSLDMRAETALSDQFEIHTGRRKSRARRGDEMRDLMRAIVEIEPLDRFDGEFRRFGFIAKHALSGRGKSSHCVEPFRIDRFVAASLGRLDARPASLYLRPLFHPLKQNSRSPIRDQSVGKLDEIAVNLVFRDRDGHTIDIGSRHRHAPISHKSSSRRRPVQISVAERDPAPAPAGPNAPPASVIIREARTEEGEIPNENTALKRRRPLKRETAAAERCRTSDKPKSARTCET